MRCLVSILICSLLVTACADGEPPVLEGVTRLPDTSDTNGPYRVDVISYDERGLDQVQLLWCVRDTLLGETNPCRIRLADLYHTVVMENLGHDHFRGVIPGQWYDQTVEYYVLAIDDSGNQSKVPEGAPNTGIITFAIKAP